MASELTIDSTQAAARRRIATWLTLAAGAVVTVWALVEVWRLGLPLHGPGQFCPAIYPSAPGCADRRADAAIATAAIVGTYALTAWAALTVGRRRLAVNAFSLVVLMIVALAGYRFTLYGLPLLDRARAAPWRGRAAAIGSAP